MTLIHRIGRLFRADIHDLLDRVEEPAVVLRQAVRDMEEELGLEQQSIGKLAREEERLGKRIEDGAVSLREIEAQLDVCFGSGKEDLARRLVKRRLEIEALQKQLSRRKTEIAETLSARKTRFQENQARLEEIRQKAEYLTGEGAAEDRREEIPIPPDSGIRDEDVEVAFLREKQKRSRS